MIALLAIWLAQELPRTGVVEPVAGQILVATAKSRDPDLARSVILLIEYGSGGAIGLMLNRPNGKAFDGGPVALGVRTLVRARNKPEGAEYIAGDVYMRPGIAQRAGARVYAGYTGWSTQQLKDELARRLWKALPFDAKIVFDPNPSTLWTRLR